MKALFGSQSGRDITSLYMDNGYLFFSVTPVEVQVDHDSIDYEMRIYEGKTGNRKQDNGGGQYENKR